jgi:hypothetical protein
VPATAATAAALVLLSDERLKIKVRRVDTGLPIYRYAYWWATDEEWLGVLAQDVLRIQQPQLHGPPPADTAAPSPSPSRESSEVPSPSPIPSPSPSLFPSRSMDNSVRHFKYRGRTDPERRSLDGEHAFSDCSVATVWREECG